MPPRIEDPRPVVKIGRADDEDVFAGAFADVAMTSSAIPSE